jgi:hypothetical protein
MTQAALIAVSAVVFLLTRQPWVVVAAAMAGNLAVGTGETGPFLSLEQVIVTRDTPRDRLTTTLSWYNLTGYAAAGLGRRRTPASPSRLSPAVPPGGGADGAYGLGMRRERRAARRATPKARRKLTVRTPRRHLRPTPPGGFRA